MKEKRSPEEIAFGEWLKKQIDESEEELDFFKPLSQIEMPPPETFMVGKPNRAYRRRKYIRRVAIVLVLVLGCTFATLELFTPEETTATKVKTGEDALESKGGFARDNERTLQTENYTAYTYKNVEELTTAKIRLSDLTIPQDMTTGYNLDELKLRIYEDSAWQSRFSYKNETGEEIAIIYSHYNNAIDAPSFEKVLSSETLNDGKVLYNIYDDKNERNMVVCLIDEFDKVSISSPANIDFSELKEIILNMK